MTAFQRLDDIACIRIETRGKQLKMIKMNIENNQHDGGAKVSKYVCLGAFTVDAQDRMVYET